MSGVRKNFDTYQVASGLRENFELVYLNLNEVLVLKKNSGYSLIKWKKIGAMNRNEFITQDSIKIVNECIVHLEGSHLCPEMNTIRWLLNFWSL